MNLVNQHIQLYWLNKVVNRTIIKQINIHLNSIGMAYKQKINSRVGL